MFFEPVINDENNDHTLHHISIHTNTHKHSTAQAHHISKQHLSINGTRLALKYSDSCFFHGANMFAAQGMSQGPCIPALKASQGCVYRETQLERCLLSSSLSTEREPTREKETEETGT